MADERTIRINFDGTTEGLNNAARSGSSAMGGWANSIKGFAASIAGLEIGEKLIDFAKESVTAFEEAQQSEVKLEDSFSRFPKLADSSIAKFKELNEQIDSKTKFDHIQLESGESILAQFNLTGAQIQNLIPLVADLATKTGTDIPTAADQLGKAFLGNTRALKELGINYKATHDQAKDTAAITQLVRDKVGGLAEKEGKTAAGQMGILSNKFQDVKESLGSKLLPALTTAGTLLLEIVDAVSKNINVIGPLVGLITAVTVAQWLWNAAMAANPIGLAVIGVAALIAGIILLVNGLGGFKKVWNDIWGGIKDTGIAVFNAIAFAWNHTWGLIDFTVPSWVPGIGGDHFAIPKIPLASFHTGGIVPGSGDQLILAKGGEGVFTPDQMASMGPTIVENHIHIGDEVTRVVRTVINDQNRATRRVVTSMAGS